LVELLVVITIIGILIALLLPAVQAAREAARQLQCKNNLKQLALSCLNHEQITGRFPSNGWGFAWTGDADRGNDWRQPGGWIYNLLPFIEQEALHEMGAGLTSGTGSPKYAAHLARLAVPLSVLHCPSRRQAITYIWNPESAGGSRPVVNAGQPSMVGRNDYAINGGDEYTDPSHPANPFWAPAPPNFGAGPASTTEVENPPGQMTLKAKKSFAQVAAKATGVSYMGSLIRISDVVDGTSLTYLVGEKYINPFEYFTGLDQGDNESSLMGENTDIVRWTNCIPQPDTPGYSASYPYWPFGSAHANGFHMACCDGSVDMVHYSIDPEIHRRLGNRKDGYVIDAKAF